MYYMYSRYVTIHGDHTYTYTHVACIAHHHNTPRLQNNHHTSPLCSKHTTQHHTTTQHHKRTPPHSTPHHSSHHATSHHHTTSQAVCSFKITQLPPTYPNVLFFHGLNGLENACDNGTVPRGQWVLFNGASFLLDLSKRAIAVCLCGWCTCGCIRCGGCIWCYDDHTQSLYTSNPTLTQPPHTIHTKHTKHTKHSKHTIHTIHTKHSKH